MHPSSRRERRLWRLGVMLSLTSWLATAAVCQAQEQEGPRGQRARQHNHQQQGQQLSPLERLRNRSAEERWQRHRDNMRLSPSDPYQRDWSVDDAQHEGATELFAPTPAQPTAASTQFPWANASDIAIGTNASSSPAAEGASNPFTPLDSELWQAAPASVVSTTDMEATQNGSSADQSADDREPTEAQAPVVNPAPDAPPAPNFAPRQADPFADSRWVDLEGGPALTSPPTGTTSIGPRQTPGANDEPWDPDLGLVAPRHSQGAIAQLDNPEQAPPPVGDPGVYPGRDFNDQMTPIRDIIPFFQPNPMPAPEVLPDSDVERNFVPTEYHWAASNVFHNPLYFEDPALERYGHTHHPLVQPFASVGKFGVQFVGLPYQMAINPVWDEKYVLGWYRPGELAPFLFYQVPWNWRAAATAAGTYTGLIFLFP